MPDTGTPPVIPADLQIYDSYTVDPQWQRKFSIIWPSVLAFFFLAAVPHLVRSVRNGRAYASLLGVQEDLSSAVYERAADVDQEKSNTRDNGNGRGALRRVEGCLSVAGAVFWWMVPGMGINLGQVVIIAGYVATVIACIVIDAPLVSNSNRAGFIALAQLPVVFLFATKNSIVSLLLGPGNGYEKLNFVHRWSGRIMFLGALLHGSLWIRNHLQYGLPIIGQQKEGSGVAAFGLLGVVVLSSLPVVRRWWYQVFYVMHMLSFIGFFVTICYHTIYASPWIFPPLAFYGFDLMMRMVRHRIKDAVLVPVGAQMTLIHIPYATSGWLAGQHVRLRVFFSGRIFESHPLTIFSAPPDVSCITSYPGGMSLGARAVGDWTKALNAYASQAAAEMALTSNPAREKVRASKSDAESSADVPVEVPVQVMIDGPYGGCSVDLGEYETALLIAGGSGITFALGMLDDIVGRVVRGRRAGGERTRKVELVWCIRSFGSIDWVAPALADIAHAAQASASLEVHMSIYVTCLCSPDAVPAIPGCDVLLGRPSVRRLLGSLTASAPNAAVPSQMMKKEKSVSSDEEIVESSETLSGDEEMGRSVEAPRVPFVARPGGGLAVCASGPEGLVREAANAVARLQIGGGGMRLGSVGLHTELFTL